jgi:hypothetical protein
MNIDLADMRELTVYRRDLWRGAPELSMLGMMLLPVFGTGAILLGFNLLKRQRQKFIVSRNQFWFQGASPLSPAVCCDRKDITGVKIRQSWLQSKLGSGDLVIRCKGLDQPIVVEGIRHVKALKQRLLRSVQREPVSTPHYLQVKVGKARWAPKATPATPAASMAA